MIGIEVVKRKRQESDIIEVIEREYCNNRGYEYTRSFSSVLHYFI